MIEGKDAEALEEATAHCYNMSIQLPSLGAKQNTTDQ
jgi:hypothetical protein